MTLLPFSRPLFPALPPLRLRRLDPAGLRPLLRLLAGSAPVLPEEMDDWQLRDLGLSRPHPGPGRLLTPWLP